MPDDTTTQGPALRNTGQPADFSAPTMQDRPLTVVLVEPHGGDLPDRATLLANTLYQVTTVEGVSELILLRHQQIFEVALLSALLGNTHLVAAARIVRSQWPRTRIVVLGKAARILDDHLYDEAISPTSEQQVLLDTLERLRHSFWTERPTGRPFVVPSAKSERVPIRQDHPAPAAIPCTSDATQDAAGTKAKA